MVGIATGGNPSSTGIFYDDVYNNNYLPAGTTVAQCTANLLTPGTVVPGVEVTYTEVRRCG